MDDYFIYQDKDEKFVVRKWERERRKESSPGNIHRLSEELGRFNTEEKVENFVKSLDKKE